MILPLMRKFTGTALLLLLMFDIASAQTTTTETFETATNNATTFTSLSKTFLIGSASSAFHIDGFYPSTGWSGTTADNKYIDNDAFATAGVGTDFSIRTQDGSRFRVGSMWLYLSDHNADVSVSGSLTLRGKLGGVTQFTAGPVSSGFNTNGATNNGFSFINLATFGGSNNSNTAIDEIEIVTTASFEYVCLDALTWTLLPSPPVAGAVSATVAHGSSNNPITLNITGGTATSVAVASAASHGTATASGTMISYTPTASYSGTDSFTYTATNAGGTSSAATVTLTVSSATIVVSPTTLPAATVGASYSQTLSASGGTAPYSFVITSGSLPAGLTLSSAGGLSGTPTAGGNFNFTVTAIDSSTGTGPFSGGRAYSLTVNTPTITVSPTTLPAAAVGASYSQTLSASGGTSTYSFAITAGVLPLGLTLSSAGALSGTPTASGTFNFTVTATDSSTGTGPYTGSRAYSLTVAASVPTAPTIGTATAGNAQATVTFTVPASDGGAAITTYTATSNPSGLTGSCMGPTACTITVNGLTNGLSYTFTVTATNSAGTGSSSAASNSVTPNPPILNITTTASIRFMIGVAGGIYSLDVSNSGTATDGTTVTVVDTLPSGMTTTAGEIDNSAAGWTCINDTPATGQVSCSRSDVVTGGASYPTIALIVDVGDTAPGATTDQATNSASVAGGGSGGTSNTPSTPNIVSLFSDGLEDP